MYEYWYKIHTIINRSAALYFKNECMTANGNMLQKYRFNIRKTIDIIKLIDEKSYK